MSTRFRRFMTATIVAGTALTGVGMTAPAAEARVPSGRYTLIQYGRDLFGRSIVDKGVARVYGRTLTLRNRGGVVNMRLTPTARGGYADVDFRVRLVLNKRANGRFAGPMYAMGIRSGSVVMIPR